MKHKNIISMNVLTILLFIFSISLFWVGYHNLDLGQNARYLECVFNEQLIDHTSPNKTITPINMYILGSNQVITSMFLLSLLFIIFYLKSITQNEICNNKKKV